MSQTKPTDKEIKFVPVNEFVVRSMGIPKFCALCEEMAFNMAPVATLEMLYSECVNRKSEVDALIVENNKLKKAKQPFKDYTQYVGPLMQAMTMLNAAAARQGVTLVRNSGSKVSNFTVHECILLLRQAAVLLSACEEDDTEAKAWLDKWEVLRKKKGFPEAKAASKGNESTTTSA